MLNKASNKCSIQINILNTAYFEDNLEYSDYYIFFGNWTYILQRRHVILFHYTNTPDTG